VFRSVAGRGREALAELAVDFAHGATLVLEVGRAFQRADYVVPIVLHYRHVVAELVLPPHRILT